LSTSHCFLVFAPEVGRRCEALRAADSHNFSIETIELADGVVLKCRGELDFSNYSNLVEALESLLDRRFTYVCLDLRELEFADSTPLRVLEDIFEPARERDVSLEMLPGPAVQRLLDVLGSPKLHGIVQGRYSGGRGRARLAGGRRPGHPRHNGSWFGEFRI
jgi:anti-anti-sigma factor